MDENNLSINKNSSILLARNNPVALILGCAGFIGSNLVDRLLAKDIQVIGMDTSDILDNNLATEKIINLRKATENKNFHLITGDAERLNLNPERLDYVFLIPEREISYKKVYALAGKLKSRILLISSILLYDNSKDSDKLSWLKDIEISMAAAAKDNKLNARILRLGPVFGPRMKFNQASRNQDAAIRLIQESLTGDLQKDTSLEFLSRFLYVDDVCDLAIKCILAGATAQKIFDGVLPQPIKVSEIKQILLDPLWYEQKKFVPSELPPWITPNLEKTIKFLNWHPKAKLMENLRLTLSYFKDNEIEIPAIETGSSKLENGNADDQKAEEGKWKAEKAGELAGLKQGIEKIEKKQSKKSKNMPRLELVVKKGTHKYIFLLAIIFILVSLIWPLVQVGWGILTFKSQLAEAMKSLQKGQFDQSLLAVKQANEGGMQFSEFINSLEPVRKIGILKPEFELGDDLSKLTNLSSDSAQNLVLGIQALYKGLKSVTGEIADSPKDYFYSASAYLTTADEDLAKSDALISSQDFKSITPGILKNNVDSLSTRLSQYSQLVKKARVLSTLMPEVVALDGSKTYLVILQNNNELRPTGGFIGSFAKVSFTNGKLQKLEVNDTYAIDGQLKIHVEPPKEIKSDLNQKDYFLRDANFEPDFPTSARQIEWFYNKETGQRVEGVVALDISAIEDLLSSLGPIDLPDYNEQITSGNLFEKAISHAEVNFFPGTQAKKSFLTALSTGLFNKLFFMSNQNWPGIVTSLGSSLDQKHMSIYLDDPKLFSYVISQNWGGLMPRASNTAVDTQNDFLAPVEANLGANKANYYLDRSYSLDTVIGKEGDINHRLRIAYTNRSPSTTFPAGIYKNRMRVYLPAGSKLNRVLWGENDITRYASGFVDYGRSGYSFLIELAPKQQKTLVLDYQTPVKLEFKDKIAEYRLDVVKQAGTIKDPFLWNVTYPINVRLTSDQAQTIGPQEQTIQTDLSTDRTFKLQFSRQ